MNEQGGSCGKSYIQYLDECVDCCLLQSVCQSILLSRVDETWFLIDQKEVTPGMWLKITSET